MKLKVVYFAYLLKDKWEKIVLEQLNCLVKCGLYNEAENIYMSVGYEEYSELTKLINLVKDNYPKIILLNMFKENLYEYPGIKTLYDISDFDNDTYILYFHSKGMTSLDNVSIRQTLFKYTISNYKEYVNKFIEDKNIDISGIIPHVNGFIFYNFFWCRSSYIKTYLKTPIITSDRYMWEYWIGTTYSSKENIITYSPILKYDKINTNNDAANIMEHLINIFKSVLYKIWQKYPTDKCKNIGHDYIPSYEGMFFPIRNDVKNVLEIGTGCLAHEYAMKKGVSNYNNGNSMRMWRDYFPNANIYAIDIFKEGMIYDEERITTFVADQSSFENLEYIKNKIGDKLDIIIDDGSHIGQHQIFSFINLEKSLSDIGIYVIEDVQPDYIEQFKNLTVFSDDYKNYLLSKYNIFYYDTRISNNKEDDFLMVFSMKK